MQEHLLPLILLGLSPEDLTRLNMDKSALLQQLLRADYSSQTRLFLGELQFSFITFVLGHSLQGESMMMRGHHEVLEPAQCVR